ncbi:MAG: ferrous iron transport protein B [Clostridiales Family XIII bacterium]|jgi:ferrous iron transport protein B|nr:ferrous iron transport protein B [Clostridiales Family XIII bacterium]
MSLTIALAGNPNSGKTTLFNALTGSNQFVGNWPGVTVEKKEGRLRGRNDIKIMDLPGVYSLSPYTLEEVIARDYLTDGRPDAILNIVDGTNPERNLYLTTQLLELGIPTVVAVNMIDLVSKNGDELDLSVLSERFGCPFMSISALKGTGVAEAADAAIQHAKNKTAPILVQKFDETVESALFAISSKLGNGVPDEQKRFFAVKLFERDEKLSSRFPTAEFESIISAAEETLDDDAESLITNDRYSFIVSALDGCYRRNITADTTLSDKIDRIVTNRLLAIPIFAAVMLIVYVVSVTTVGAFATDWANDGVFGEGWSFFGLWVPGVPTLAESALTSVGATDIIHSLVSDGVIAGVGAVLGFVPQMLILFVFLAFLEGCGYMARVAFIMDRIFRKFGLSGKSFIPILIGTGCGVPGIMSCRTIENDRDRKMTIITTTFIPCGAKLPIIALIAGALFGGAWWMAPSAYFVGIAAIVSSGVILKKTHLFVGNPAPFVMELPAYHMPTAVNVLRSVWERGSSFIKRAGTIILASAVVIWFLSSFGVTDGAFGPVDDLGDGLLAVIGNGVAWIFAPLGFGDWQATVATFTGLIAKENIVNTFGVLYGFAEVAEDGSEIWGSLSASFTPLAAYSFLVFNLLCAPCFAAIGAIRREMNSAKWTFIAIGYQTGFAYSVALCIFQFGSLFTTGVFGAGTVAAIMITGLFLNRLLRRAPQYSQ